MPDETETADTDQARPPTRSMALVMNAKAGALLGQQGGTGTLEDLLREQASRLDVVPEDAGTLPERVARARQTGCECVVVAGGDGTIACAAQVLAGTDIALGLIPCGTMNLLAHDLGIDPAERDASVRILGQGRPRAIDVGEVTGRDQPSHLFLCASMLGTPARLSRFREAGRGRGDGPMAWLSFGLAAARALGRNRSMHLTLRYDGRERRVRTPSITITVNPLDDAAGHLFGRSSLDGGTLAVYLVHRDTVFAQARLLLRTALRGSLHAPQIEVIHTKALEVHSRHAAVHVLVDGERRLLAPPLRYGIRPRALTVIAPG